MKLHPSIVIYSVDNETDSDVIVNDVVEYHGPSPLAYAQARSTGLWQVEIDPPYRARRTPRKSEWEWS
jgi:beta-galactosidase/beta-glucuronidase